MCYIIVLLYYLLVYYFLCIGKFETFFSKGFTLVDKFDWFDLTSRYGYVLPEGVVTCHYSLVIEVDK